MHRCAGALALLATLILGNVEAASAGPWSGPHALPAVGTPYGVKIDAAPGAPAQVMWSEGADVIRATAGPSGVTARETIGSTGTWGRAVAAGAGDRPFVSWAEDGALFLARSGFGPETVAGHFGAGWDGACCPITPASATHGTSAIAFADEWPEGWSVFTEDQSGARRAFLGDIGPVDDMALAAAGGRIAAAWTAPTPNGETASVNVSTVEAGGTAGPSVVVSTPGRHARELDAAAGPDGAITVTWTESDPPVPAPGGGYTISGGSVGLTVDIAPDGTVGQTRPIPGAPGRLISPRVLRDGSGRTTFAFTSDPIRSGAGTVLIVERSATGAVAVTDPGLPGTGSSVVLAGSTDGGAAVITLGLRGLASVFRPPGGGWQQPQAVDPACGPAQLGDLTVADGWAYMVSQSPVAVYSAPLDGATGPPPCSIPGSSRPLTGSGPWTPASPAEGRRPTAAAPQLRALGGLRPGQRTVRLRVTCATACRARLETTAIRGATIAQGRVVRRALKARRPVIVTLRLTAEQRKLLRSRRSRLVVEVSAPRAGHRSLLRRIQLQPR